LSNYKTLPDFVLVSKEPLSLLLLSFKNPLIIMPIREQILGWCLAFLRVAEFGFAIAGTEKARFKSLFNISHCPWGGNAHYLLRILQLRRRPLPVFSFSRTEYWCSIEHSGGNF
jgi:hypothetical protein